MRSGVALVVLVVGLVLVGVRDSQAGTLGPSTPPAGVDAGLWGRMYSRATLAAKVALSGRSQRDQDCGRDKLLVTLYALVRAASPGALVDGSKAETAREQLRRNRDITCGDDSGPGSAVGVALYQWAHFDREWADKPEYGPPLVPEPARLAGAREALSRAAAAVLAAASVDKAVAAVRAAPGGAELLEAIQAAPARAGLLLTFDPDALGIYNPVRARTRTDGL